MLGRRQMLNSGDRSFKNSQVSKRKRRVRIRSRYKKSYLPDTSLENGSFKSSNINPLSEDTLFFNDGPLVSQHPHEREGNQLQYDSCQFSEVEEWSRRVRSTERDSFGEASACFSSNNIGRWCSPDENGEKLRLTDMWRNMLLPESDMGLHLMSEEIFKENVNTLLEGIDFAESNPSVWSRLDSNHYFNKVQTFTENWSRELLKEKEKLDEEVWLAKEKLKIKYDLVTNRLSLLTSVYEESVSCMNFSEGQKQAIQSQTRELNAIKSKLIDCEVDSLVSHEASLKNRLKEKDQELELSQKQADEFREELRQTQNKLKATQAELSNLIYANNQKTQLEQKEMQDKLSEIRSMLVKKPDLGHQNGRLFNNDLNKENYQIINDIKSLIGYSKQLTLDENVKVTTEIIQKAADSSILQVTENEMQLVTLIASFLKVTPFPVSTEFIYLYVAKIDNIVDLQYVERLLKKFPTFFKEETTVPGSTEMNWSYLDLKPIITI